jgi:glycosyltransferase involved in cell wall biosynthesis
MSELPFDSIICFGGEDWWYHNHGHFDMQIMRRFAQLGTVLYINSIVMQKPNLSQSKQFVQKLIRKTKSILTGLEKSNAGFWVYSPFSLPVQHLDWARPINETLLNHQLRRATRNLHMKKPVVWVACPTACDIAFKITKNKLVYQRTDRFEDSPNVEPKVIKKYDQRLKDRADLTIFVNRSLYEEEFKQCKKAIYLDHGVDFEMFESACLSPYVPADMRDIQKPIIGYFGGIADHKVDIGFIEQVINFLPDMSFVFVGQASSDYNYLKYRNNVWMLGQKLYKDIPQYGKCFDVAILPWRQNCWTQAANPIKFKEYLALGKPVVSTSIKQLQQYHDELLYLAKTPQEFAHCIKRALAEDNAERISARRKKVQSDSWDNKAQIVLNTLLDKGGHDNA